MLASGHSRSGAHAVRTRPASHVVRDAAPPPCRIAWHETLDTPLKSTGLSPPNRPGAEPDSSAARFWPSSPARWSTAEEARNDMGVDIIRLGFPAQHVAEPARLQGIEDHRRVAESGQRRFEGFHIWAVASSPTMVWAR